MLNKSAHEYGRPEYNNPPRNAGNYKDLPQNVPFYNNGENNYRSEYGQFFLKWYSDVLIEHGRE